jgi:predicted PurR-regulated permease PerM
MGHRRFQGANNERDERRPRREFNSVGEFATRATVAVAILCLGVIALWLLYRATDILLVIFGGVVIAVLLQMMAAPITRQTRLPKWAAVSIAVLVVFGLFALGGWLMAAPVSRQFDELTVRLPEAFDRFRAQFLSFKWMNWLWERGTNAAPDGQKVLRQMSHAFQMTMQAAAALVIVIFLAIYMAASPRTYVHGLVRLLPVSYRARALEVAREVHRVLRVWLLTKLISMAFVAVCTAIGLWALKVPLALALALLAGLFEFIPNIGPLLSAAPAVLLGFTHSPSTALYVGLLYFGVQWVQNHVTNPLLQQRTLSLPPALTLSLTALMATFFGFGGLLLSGPLSVVVIVLVRKVYIEDVLERRNRSRERSPELTNA